VILDSSAIVAMLRDEPESGRFLEIVGSTDKALLSAGTLLETSIVVGHDWHAPLDEFLSTSGSTVVPFDEAQARIARQAYVRYGKGSGSPARLNFGDCISYALAKTTGMPLLFKGDDLTHTDVVPALTR
jgi:ribonuclease VapC